MALLTDLISSIKKDNTVNQVLIGTHWTAVVSRYCGLSSTFEDPPPHRPIEGVGSLTQKTALEVAEFANSDTQLEASIGMAALNSLIEVDERRCIELNAFDELATQGKEKKIAIVGHFPFIPKLRKLARTLWVLEMNLRPGDLPAEKAEDILPQADVIGITAQRLLIIPLMAYCPCVKKTVG